MPFFRRRAQAEELVFSVGVDGHQVVVNGNVAGCRLFDDVDDYVGIIARRMPSTPDGRDSIAVQNAKMDYAEMAEAAVLVVTLALEELTAQGLLEREEIPRKPEFPAMAQDISTYDYIQTTFQRAERRLAWVHKIDELLREKGIGIVKVASQT